MKQSLKSFLEDSENRHRRNRYPRPDTPLAAFWFMKGIISTEIQDVKKLLEKVRQYPALSDGT